MGFQIKLRPLLEYALWQAIPFNPKVFCCCHLNGDFGYRRICTANIKGGFFCLQLMYVATVNLIGTPSCHCIATVWYPAQQGFWAPKTNTNGLITMCPAARLCNHGRLASCCIISKQCVHPVPPPHPHHLRPHRQQILHLRFLSRTLLSFSVLSTYLLCVRLFWMKGSARAQVLVNSHFSFFVNFILRLSPWISRLL